jgi:hypothetical protein
MWPFQKKIASDKDLIPVFIPSLSAILVHHEKEKGSPLTEAEVLAIRDKAAVMMIPRADLAIFEERRGYKDIEPELCWLQWRLLRLTLNENKQA